MKHIETILLADGSNVSRRLEELGLDLEGLLNVRDYALGIAANVTLFFAPNGAGTLAYQYGIAALREIFYTRFGWVLNNDGNIPSIVHPYLNTRVTFCNVNVACSLRHDPKPRSDKGPGAETACRDNLLLFAPRDIPQIRTSAHRGRGLHYLAMDEKGALELLMPVVENGTFSDYIERIFLSDGSDIDPYTNNTNETDFATYFDPMVALKT